MKSVTFKKPEKRLLSSVYYQIHSSKYFYYFLEQIDNKPFFWQNIIKSDTIYLLHYSFLFTWNERVRFLKEEKINPILLFLWDEKAYY